MTNKSRRDEDQRIRLSETQMMQPGMEEKAAEQRDASSSAAKSSHLAEQFHYVGADLRRIVLIAAVMLTILIGLAVVLP